MNILNNEELMNIKGGAVATKTAIFITSIFTFLAGVLDGWFHTKKCR